MTWLLVLLALVASPALAEPLTSGDRLEPLSLPDQHGEMRRLDEDTRLVLFARDMDGGGHLKGGVEGFSAEELAERGVVYVADVHRMPSLVRRLFAMPSLRRRPYPVLIDETGEATARLPAEEGKATLLRLDGLRVAEVGFAESPEAVRLAVRGLRPAATGAEDEGTSGP